MTTNQSIGNEGAEKSKSFFNKALTKYLVWIGIMAVLVVIVNVI